MTGGTGGAFVSGPDAPSKLPMPTARCRAAVTAARYKQKGRILTMRPFLFPAFCRARRHSPVGYPLCHVGLATAVG